MHMNCRDRNRVALIADLLGAKALGVSSLLVMRGKQVQAGVEVKQVYDWGAKKLIAAANSMEDADFLIGSIATVFKPDRDWKPEQLPTKADAGVRFVQTQICFNIDLLRHYMARLVAERITQRVNVIVGLAPLPSADIAQSLGKNLRGAVVPAKVVKRLRQAPDPEREGIELCAELLNEMADIPGVSGANLMCFGDTAAVADAIRLSGVRSAAIPDDVP
jgi:methylenetetrahydrofolate reductase (NADPH)